MAQRFLAGNYGFSRPITFGRAGKRDLGHFLDAVELRHALMDALSLSKQKKASLRNLKAGDG
jgi:hypothetical protein